MALLPFLRRPFWFSFPGSLQNALTATRPPLAHEAGVSAGERGLYTVSGPLELEPEPGAKNGH